MDLKKKMKAHTVGHIPGLPYCSMREVTIIDVEGPYVKLTARPNRGRKFYEFWIEAVKVERYFKESM